MRLHINLNVENLNKSVRFYSDLFAAKPAVLKDDYAKWMLEDPKVNFAISTRRPVAGTDHFGIQVDSEDELRAVHARLKSAELPMSEEGKVACCYARSDKAWIFDPDGNAWESFYTFGDSPVYGEETVLDTMRNAAGTAE
jgi:catechol 2,3-dioxygenase-like lactoylglutathione lyase family enzyme